MEDCVALGFGEMTLPTRRLASPRLYTRSIAELQHEAQWGFPFCSAHLHKEASNSLAQAIESRGYFG